MTEQASFPALGTTATVMVAGGRRLDLAMQAVKRTVEAYDQACSRFREDSELSTLNRSGGHAVRAGPVLLDAVAAAVRAAEVTGGDVDPSLGAALIALGYDRDFDLGLDDRTRAPIDPAARQGGMTRGRMTFAAVPGWRTIRLDRRAATIALDPGVILDLGATAKALASDHAAGAARGDEAGGVLVSLGGDIATAGQAPGEGWRIRVTDDHRSGPEVPGQWITIRAGGLATSSTSARRWRRDGQDLHHLIDPSSRLPARSPWRTVSVAAASCLDANIASTAAIIRGHRASAWLEELGLAARLVDHAGGVVRVGGWPAEGDDLTAADVPAWDVRA